MALISDSKQMLVSFISPRDVMRGPKTAKYHVAVFDVKVHGPHAVHYLLDLFHSLLTLRELHRGDHERPLVPTSAMAMVASLSKLSVMLLVLWPRNRVGKRRSSQPVGKLLWRFHEEGPFTQ